MLATYEKDSGRGPFEPGALSNPAFDAMLGKAVEEFDLGKRNALLADAQRIAFRDVGMIRSTGRSCTGPAARMWRSREPDGRHYAMSARPAK